jgi:uncharacterized glyoxalase superfamily protein PhnB
MSRRLGAIYSIYVAEDYKILLQMGANMPDPAPPSTPPVKFGRAVPILRVSNLQKSVAYYEKVLGFEQNWISPPLASVSRDRCSVMLAEGEQGNPATWVWFGVDDAQKVYEEYKASGAKIILPPKNYPWALEMRVEDPDGHVLRLGSDPIESD